ncbi:ankyrin repeat domain-containing protein 61-like [Notothenia coriiceps]|uniref:Ankyrin repeat domain-containing protein 61-like n=1 Tax=Notothenia coriiceps TaxID=8208 RepID=A0A6I9N138_9TELE|nr:PREDICTED: ankyrin repeat domain-containing protein 61-like [Notothenia coriiceps]
MSNKYWGHFLPTIGDTPGEDLWKGVSTLPLHMAATYRRAASLQSLLTAGEDPEIRDQLGRTTLHLVIASWPSINPKPGSRFQAAVSGERRGAETCLRLLCEHGVNLNAEVKHVHKTDQCSTSFCRKGYYGSFEVG